MSKTDFNREWRALADEVLSGMGQWRREHPKATWREIEQALDERLSRLRARMLEDVAQASAACEWKEQPEEERPRCPSCGQALVSRGSKGRSLRAPGGQEVSLQRSYGVCPGCGLGLFPPG